MKRAILKIIFIFLSLFSFAQSKLTLQQCIETGIANNQQVLQTELQRQTAKVNLKQARVNMFPNLNGNASQGINQGRSIDPFTNGYTNQQTTVASYGLNSGVLLFNGLSIQNNIKQNAFAYEASKMDWQQAKDNLTINIILAYLQVLNSEDIMEQSRNQLEVSRKQVERLEVLNKQGAISPSQLSDLKGQFAGDELSIISAQNSLESSKISLCQLMNVPYSKDMQLERISMETVASKYETTPDSIYQTALQQFALIKASRWRVRSAEKNVKALRGNLFPSLSLNGGVNTNYSSAAQKAIFLNTTDVSTSSYVIVSGNHVPVFVPQNNYSSQKIGYSSQLGNNVSSYVSLNLTIPIFNSFQARNRVTIAKIDLKNSELADKTTKTQLQQEIEQAHLNMTTAFDRYKTLLEQVNAYEESFRAAQIRFDSGLGTSVDYLIAKNNLDRANISLISAKYDYVLRMKILDYYQGKQLW